MLPPDPAGRSPPPSCTVLITCDSKMPVLTVNSRIQIPHQEFTFTFVRSSGPGGQNVNKVNSKAVLRWPVMQSADVAGEVRQRFVARFGRRLTGDGELVLTSQRYRDQARNVVDCLEKLKPCSCRSPRGQSFASQPSRHAARSPGVWNTRAARPQRSNSGAFLPATSDAARTVASFVAVARPRSARSVVADAPAPGRPVRWSLGRRLPRGLPGCDGSADRPRANSSGPRSRPPPNRPAPDRRRPARRSSRRSTQALGRIRWRRRRCGLADTAGRGCFPCSGPAIARPASRAARRVCPVACASGSSSVCSTLTAGAANIASMRWPAKLPQPASAGAVVPEAERVGAVGTIAGVVMTSFRPELRPLPR